MKKFLMIKTILMLLLLKTTLLNKYIHFTIIYAWKIEKFEFDSIFPNVFSLLPNIHIRWGTSIWRAHYQRTIVKQNFIKTRNELRGCEYCTRHYELSLPGLERVSWHGSVMKKIRQTISKTNQVRGHLVWTTTQSVIAYVKPVWILMENG